MKHINGKGREKSWTRTFAYAISALTLSIVATACGNKDNGGSNVAVVPGIGASCVGCSATMNKVIASGTTRARNDYTGAEEAELSLNFFGDSAVGSSVQGYRGSFGATGMLRVRVARPAPCNIPAGDYPITTTTAGVWSGQSFGNLQLQATGPVVLRLDIPVGLIQSVTPAVTDWAQATFPYLIKLRAYVTPISTGGYCNTSGSPTYYFED